MLHLRTAVTTSTRSDIEERLTGRFYTPHEIAEQLAQSPDLVGCPESVCDPFCGDGRLVTAWLRQQGSASKLRNLRKIGLWDYDAEAVTCAELAVRSVLEDLEAEWVTVEARVGDSFGASSDERFDLVLTNPPWEQLKPDTRDEIADAGRYRDEVRAYAARLTELLPGAATCRKRSIGGYTVNLARAGALLAAKLTSPKGTLKIVLPSTIFGDQVSSLFREEFFSSIAVSRIEFYPAEAKLFSGVDQAFVTVVGRSGLQSSKVEITRFRPDLSVGDRRDHSLSVFGAPLPLAIDGSHHELVEWLREKHPEATWLESDLRYALKLGRELDETRIAESFSEGSSGLPFVKGRNIGRFACDLGNLPNIDRRLRRIPESAFERRLAWRDVSRPSQKRRVHACIVPAGVVTGNSLGVARFKSPQPHLLETLLAVMNSFAFEIQVRGSLATNHVSQGVIRRCVVPYAAFENELFRSEVAELVGNPTQQNQTKLEIMVAKAYGFSRDDFAVLLKAFDRMTEDEVSELLDKDKWF